MSDRPPCVDAAAVELLDETRGTMRVAVWREPTLQYTKLWGSIDDDGSVFWRGALDRIHAQHGFTPFMLLDVFEAEAVNTMPMRLKSAAWARELLTHLTEGLIYNGKNAKSGFVIRTILRVAGMPNVSTIGTEPELARALTSWRSGARVVV